jgi:site-specific DNA-methyltransferase (adenine-specific)
MAEKSPRNQTLEVGPEEAEKYLNRCMTLSKKTNPIDLENQVIFQDMLEAIKLLPDNFVDLLLVDPPYNLTKQYGDNKFSKIKDDEYEIWLENWIIEVKRCLKSDASIYVCTDWQSSKMVQNVLERHFKIRNRITWEREKGRGAKANWKNCSEDIWFCTVSNDYYFDVEAVKLKRKVIAPYTNQEGDPKDWEKSEAGNFRLTFPSNLWTDITLPFWSMPENTPHPTQKPEKLIAKLILASSAEGDLVFDPFMGSGTTCVVSKKLGRKFLGIEKEPEYCQLAIKRLDIAERNQAIQGYHDRFFWERNTLTEQQSGKSKKTTINHDQIDFEE